MLEIPSIVLKTRELLTLRGYTVSELLEYENRYVMYPKRKKDNRVLTKTVWIFKEPKIVGIAVVKDILNDMEEKETYDGMLVGGVRFTPAAKKHAAKARVELVVGNYASFDIFDHNLVPNHGIADDSEIDMILKHYGITKSQLPRIAREDPAAKAIGAKTGNVIRIERDSPIAGKTFYYRIVADMGR
jgi:DNA-directed RNA polymerase subunit H